MRALALVSVGWLPVVAACGAETDAPRSRGSTSGAAGAPTVPGAPSVGVSGSANSPNVLITPAPGASSAVNSGANGCQAGHYVGVFTGTYNSGAWGNGWLPLSVAAVPSMGRPGLEFWLEKTTTDCNGAEFCPDFSVKGGKIRGFADPFSDGSASSGGSSDDFAVAVRFEIDFGGELDCARGQFRGLLQNGCYDVVTILFRFEGTAPATYDQASSSFTNGQWSVKEMPMEGVLFPPDANIGGMGTWEASLVQDNAPPMDASSGLCHM